MIVALVSGFGWHVQDLQRAAHELDLTFHAVPFPAIVGRIGHGTLELIADGIRLEQADAVLVRMMPPGSLEQVVYRMDALHRLEATGVPVLNPPRAIEAAVDKFLATAQLAACGVPVPDTVACESARDALDAFETLGGDVVIKPLFGSEGRGLMRVSDRELFRRAAFALERLNSVLYVQKYVPNAGSDLRIFVLDDKPVGAIRRFAAEGDWRTNVAVGGRAEAVDLATLPEAAALATDAARAVRARVAGVDLLPDPETGGWLVLEVNAVPGWRALSTATGVDIARRLLIQAAGKRS